MTSLGGPSTAALDEVKQRLAWKRQRRCAGHGASVSAVVRP